MVVIKGKDYLTMTEFTKAIGKSRTTADAYVRKGYITPALKIDKHMYFTAEQLEQFNQGFCIPVKKRGD